MIAASPSRPIWEATRSASLAFAGNVGGYVPANLAWLVVMWVTLSASVRRPVVAVLLLLLVPITGGLSRMAGRTVRGGNPGWKDFRTGLTHRMAVTWSMGVIGVVVVLVGGANVAIAAAGGRPLMLLSGLLSIHVMFVTFGLWVTMWPLLTDPMRDGLPPRVVLREALVVLAARPARLVILLLGEGVLAVAQFTVAATSLVLPSVMLLLASFVVLPEADRLATLQTASRSP